LRPLLLLLLLVAGLEARGQAVPDAPEMPGRAGLSLESLAATRLRPLFTPGRRPAAPAAVVQPAPAAPTPPPPAPAYDLTGTVVGNGVGIAFFRKKRSDKIIMLRKDQPLDGWVLAEVQADAVVLTRNEYRIGMKVMAKAR
jgi:general secretion pathway protein N